MIRFFFVSIILIFTVQFPFFLNRAIAAEKESGYQLFLPAIIGNIALVCPSSSTRFVLVPSHTWTWSPGGQASVGVIQGSTTSGSCDIWVAGDVASGPDCSVSYTNSGNIGTCQHSGQSTAVLSFEGTCSKGKISLTITEGQDPDAGIGGVLVCPEVSEPYPTFYPGSITTGSFFIDSEGYTVTESKTDPLGFTYTKKWIIMPASSIP